MIKKWTVIFLLAIFAALLLGVSTACLRAKVPDKGEPPSIDPNAAPDAEGPSKDEPIVYTHPIDATLSGKEYGFDNVKFTHIAIKADESLEWMVAVWVALNGDFQGKIYANGWEDQIDEKIRIGPGDTSVWVPLRGTWLTGENVLQLKFITPSVGNMEVPARYFKGLMYLKNDPKLLDKQLAGEEIEPDSPGDDGDSKTDEATTPSQGE